MIHRVFFSATAAFQEQTQLTLDVSQQLPLNLRFTALASYEEQDAASGPGLTTISSLVGLSWTPDPLARILEGDLYVELRHGGIAVAVYDGQNEETPWADDVSISELEIKGFEGARVDGDWELVVFDSFRLDIGTIESWDLTFEVKR